MMNIQEELENYNSRKASIRIAKSEIRKLKNKIVDYKGANLDGMPKPQGFVSSSVENFVINKQEKIEELQKDIDENEDIIEIIENLVNTLKKYNQDIISMRYYQKMSIEEISVVKSKTYGAIKNTIEKSVDIMQKEYDKNIKL